MSNGEQPPEDGKLYLGDGVYVTHDGCGQVTLTVNNGIFDTARVFLNPSVMRNFERWVERARAEKWIP